jgi:hypothetical protein
MSVVLHVLVILHEVSLAIEPLPRDPQRLDDEIRSGVQDRLLSYVSITG